MRPISVGTRDAKINLSRLLKKVQNGAEITITDRNEPVAKIVPITSEEHLSLNERIVKLERDGLLQPSEKKKLINLPPPLPLPDEAGQRMLEEDRG